MNLIWVVEPNFNKSAVRSFSRLRTVARKLRTLHPFGGWLQNALSKSFDPNGFQFL
jgi:hypothetical protein